MEQLLTAPQKMKALPCDLLTNLKTIDNSDSLAQKIDVGVLVAGLTGWGVSSSKKADTGKIDRSGFMNLDRKNRLKRFIKWTNGELEKKTGREFSHSSKKELN
jgi:hypothetical protein